MHLKAPLYFDVLQKHSISLNLNHRLLPFSVRNLSLQLSVSWLFKLTVFFIFFSFFTLYATNSYSKTMDTLVVFGDSLSDNGNLYKKFLFRIPKSPPYFLGRFSNGYVWADLMDEQFYDVSIINHAYGSAQTSGLYPVPGLIQQIQNYFKNNIILQPENTVFSILIGANNYLPLLDTGNQVSEAEVAATVNDIATAINNLVSNGAVNILIFNLPNLGDTPRAVMKEQSGNKFYRENAAVATQLHNRVLNSLLYNLQQNYKLSSQHVNLITVDLASFFQSIIQDLQANPTSNKYFELQPGHSVKLFERCYTGDYYGKNGKVCDYPKEYVFWDMIHPSYRMHSLLAQHVKQVLMEDYHFEDKRMRVNTQDFNTRISELDALEQYNQMIHE